MAPTAATEAIGIESTTPAAAVNATMPARIATVRCTKSLNGVLPAGRTSTMLSNNVLGPVRAQVQDGRPIVATADGQVICFG